MSFQPKTFDNDIEVQGVVTAISTFRLGFPLIVGTSKVIEAIGADANIRIDLIPKGTSPVRLPSGYITRINDNEDIINKEYADKRIASKQLGTNLLAPGVPENGFAIVWDNTTGTFILAPSAGSNTFGSGIENVAGTVKLGGIPLDRHTEIVGNFDLRLGTTANKLANLTSEVTGKTELIAGTTRITLNGTIPFDLVGGAALSSISINAGGAITITDNQPSSLERRGLRGGADYSNNVTNNDYVQKIYVDSRLASKPVSALVTTPGPSNHNWAVVWDSALSSYTLFNLAPTATAKKQQRFTADGIQTSFTVTNGTLDQIDFVEVNGAVQQLSVHYTVAVQVVSFGTALPAGSSVTIHYFDGLILGTGGSITLGSPMEIPFVDGTGTDLEYNVGLKYNVGTGKLQTTKLNISTAPDVDNALTGLLMYDPVSGDIKQKSVSSIDHFKGIYLTVADLITAHPTANDGDYAFVDAGVGAGPEFYIWDSSDNVWALGGSGGGEFSIVGRGFWKFSTSTSTAPPTGQVRFNTATISAISRMYINEVSDEGSDVANFMPSVSVGDKFYIQQKDDSTRWLEAIVNSDPIDQGSWWEIPIIVEDSSGALPSNTAPTLIRLAGGVGGLSQFITEYFTANGVATVFTLSTVETVDIVGVYFGGQRMKEGVHYTKNNSTKAVTTTSVIPNGIGIDVEYIAGVIAPMLGSPNWTESTFGLARISTQTETNAGIDDLSGITPLKLKTWWDLKPATQAEMITGTSNDKVATPLSSELKRSVKSLSLSNATSGTINIDCLSKQEVKIVFENTVTGNITLSRSNDSALEIMNVTLSVTGTITITFPSDVRMDRIFENSSWNQGSKILFITSVSAGDIFELSLLRMGSVFLLRYGGPARA